MPESSTTSATFGRGLRSQFLFDEKFLNLNHGSFGATPRAVRDVMRSFQDRVEATPDAFILYEYPKLLDQARAAIAQLLRAPEDTVVLVPNATSGINTVLRNLVFEPGDSIVHFNTIYGACGKTVEHITETTPARAVKLDFQYPIEDDWLVEEFTRVVKAEQAKGRVRIAIFDVITSMPGCRVPFERLTQACKDLGVLSCIDGAHGVGHVPLDLGTLDPDFFVSNCHKWLYVPRGCAVFYVPTRNQHLIRSTLPTSHGFTPLPKPGKSIVNPLPPSGQSQFVQNFQFYGTIDNTNFLCIPAAIEYRSSLGGEDAIMEYCWQLARDAADHVASVLGTEVMENSTRTLGNCCMSNIRLPISIDFAASLCPGKDHAEVGALVRAWMALQMVEKHHTHMPIIFYGQHWWVRLSGQVYLDMKDFEAAASILKTVCARVNAGDFAPGGFREVVKLPLLEFSTPTPQSRSGESRFTKVATSGP